MNKYYIINSLNEIDLQMVVNDYLESFTKERLLIHTTYEKLKEFEIRFSKRDIHHLLGFHKVINKNNHATKTLQSILEGNLTIKEMRKHPNFGEIKNRLLNYNFLHKCFIDKKIKLCVIPKEKNKNPQKLEGVFIDHHNDIRMLLGLKMDCSKKYYVPATMYQMNDSSVYNRTKRTNITSIEWNPY
ncbi:PBECR4 domain-containing protein [Staphylococcus pseudoxylosus]|uniref:PBECR4 domain-containing protein n=1 Tax=Staphylococcus pseudoxylosus TaxID=2282419 RepID=UPI002DB64A8C|nr:PBECR4 domain-containing protein [Staphylococcus pseudoxylosus]MEB7763015.1 PBECR4 domain-containing protein [Staphylococcus pseudoxylosus]